jgi:hypothetical protein
MGIATNPKLEGGNPTCGYRNPRVRSFLMLVYARRMAHKSVVPSPLGQCFCKREVAQLLILSLAATRTRRVLRSSSHSPEYRRFHACRCIPSHLPRSAL